MPGNKDLLSMQTAGTAHAAKTGFDTKGTSKNVFYFKLKKFENAIEKGELLPTRYSYGSNRRDYSKDY